MTLKVARVCKGLNPWRLITCPVCGGRAFTSLDYASVWCDECNAQFEISYTGGDAGFVCRCNTENVHRGDTIYADGKKTTLKDRGWKIPKTGELSVVVKTCYDVKQDAKTWIMIGEHVFETWEGRDDQLELVSAG